MCIYFCSVLLCSLEATIRVSVRTWVRLVVERGYFYRPCVRVRQPWAIAQPDSSDRCSHTLRRLSCVALETVVACSPIIHTSRPCIPRTYQEHTGAYRCQGVEALVFPLGSLFHLFVSTLSLGTHAPSLSLASIVRLSTNIICHLSWAHGSSKQSYSVFSFEHSAAHTAFLSPTRLHTSSWLVLALVYFCSISTTVLLYVSALTWLLFTSSFYLGLCTLYYALDLWISSACLSF